MVLGRVQQMRASHLVFLIPLVPVWEPGLSPENFLGSGQRVGACSGHLSETAKHLEFWGHSPVEPDLTPQAPASADPTPILYGRWLPCATRPCGEATRCSKRLLLGQGIGMESRGMPTCGDLLWPLDGLGDKDTSSHQAGYSLLRWRGGSGEWRWLQ